MRYVLCIFMPPIAVLTTGKVGAFFLCILLTLLGWIPGLIYSILMVNKYYADQRHEELLRMQAVFNNGGTNGHINQGYYPPPNQQQYHQQGSQQAPYPGQYPPQQHQTHYIPPPSPNGPVQ